MIARAVVVLAKVPAPGASKTRLAAVIGEGAAVALARAMLEDTLAALDALDAAVALRWSVSGDEGAARALAPPRWQLERQVEGDLGARIAAAHRGAGARRVALVGADAPAMSAARVTAALDALDAADVVVGPTPDGGYDLIALGALAPAILEDMPWSTPRLLEETRVRARRAGLGLVELAPGFDVDTAADLVDLVDRLDRARAPAPATRAWLAHRRAPG